MLHVVNMSISTYVQINMCRVNLGLENIPAKLCSNLSKLM